MSMNNFLSRSKVVSGYVTWYKYLMVFIVISCAILANCIVCPSIVYGEHPVHAFINAEIIIDPEKTLTKGIVIIRDGIITGVGEDMEIPEDAMVWDLAGKVVSPGWIDMFVPSTVLQGKHDAGNGPGQKNGISDRFGHKANKDWIETLPSVHPDLDPLKDITLSPDTAAELRSQGITTALVCPAEGIFMGYAHLMNLGDTPVYEALLYPEIAQCISLEYGKNRDVYPSSLMGSMALIRQTFLDVDWYTDVHSYWNNTSNGPRPPYISPLKTLGSFHDKNGLFCLRADRMLDVFRLASLAREFSLRACIIGNGEEYKRIRELRTAGYPMVVPVAFPKLHEIKNEAEYLDLGLNELRHWDRAPSNPYWLEKTGVVFALTSRDLEPVTDFRKMIGVAMERGLSRECALAALTTVPARILGLEQRIGTITPGKIANLIISDGDPLLPDSSIEKIWVDGKRYPVDLDKEQDRDKKHKHNTKKNGKHGYELEGLGPHPKGSRDTQSDVPPLDPCGPIISPEKILVTGATIWTCGPSGKLEHHDMLVENGRIIKIAETIEPDDDMLVVDASGKHVTPGIIDEHSHAFVQWPVNEGTYSSAAEVRIADILDSESGNIYLQLAGGVTTASVFHGSANVIGGQTAVIKLRWGASVNDLIFGAAPIGIKFALGENVKQSNWGERYKKRFPQSRMGVEEFVRERFTSARDYLIQKETEMAKRAAGEPCRPVRRNLELDALGDVITGKMPVHCHGYRADEMLMLIRLAEEFHFKLATFEHCLEGYKIAKEMAEHGVGASIFSDWWAYKIEVYDAIPYDAAIMWEKGVLVAMNSDSAELARRLNLEAAKAIKYGNVPEEEALKFVTINPAIMLSIEARTGSLEPGKDADFTIWSKNPLSTSTMCEQTWIEGKKYFDVEEDQQLRKKFVKEHDILVKLAKKSAEQQSKRNTD